MVAKNRRSRRARRLQSAPNAGARPTSPSSSPSASSSPSSSPESPEQLSQRLDSLRDEIAAAKADADRRTIATSGAEQAPTSSVAVATEKPELTPPIPRPEAGGRGRGRLMAGALLGLAVVGVVVGLVATSSSKTSSPSNAVSVYAKRNLPTGTSVGVVGGVHGVLPSRYQTHSVASTSAIGGYRYVLAPDPLTKAGPSLTNYIEKNATLLAVAPSQATLWMLNVTPGAPPAPSTTTRPAPSTTVAPAPSTTVAPAPSTTVAPAPSTTVAPAPSTTLPPAPPTVPPAPATTVPSTTVPPAPATTVPPAPAATSPPATPVAHSVTVQMGESFWSIAQSVVQQRLGTTPTTAQVATYWTQLINANLSNLPHPGDPDLIYVGQTLVVPSG